MVSEACEMVGRRVQIDGHRGTVRFEGTLPDAPGRWLGVEWDDAARGKHDGVRNGERFFTTECPTGGSFVRESKLDAERSCADVLLDKYSAAFEAQRISFRTGVQDAVKEAEFVGFESGQRPDELRTADVSGLCVRTGDDRLQTLCPRLSQLDLGRSLVSSMADVASIVRNLPSLDSLVLSHNRIADWRLDGVLDTVKHLVVGNMRLDTLDTVARLFPNLESLFAPGNCIKKLRPLPLPKLTELDLDNNLIEDWEQVLVLASLPALRVLNLSRNRIQTVTGRCEAFRTLRTFLLSGNKIDEWSSVDALAALPALEELSMRDNPVLATEKLDTARQLLICRVERVRTLDKVEVTPPERRGAALDYLKKYGEAYLAALAAQDSSDALASFHRTHPCYQRLVTAYGAPEAVSKAPTGQVRLVRLQLKTSEQTLEKRLPRTMKLQRLRGLLSKLLGPDAATSHLHLRCVSSQRPDVVFEMDNDLKDLAYYSLQDDDTILIEW